MDEDSRAVASFQGLAFSLTFPFSCRSRNDGSESSLFSRDTSQFLFSFTYQIYISR